MCVNVCFCGACAGGSLDGCVYEVLDVSECVRVCVDVSMLDLRFAVCADM